MIVGLDGTGHITVFNRAAESVTGISRGDALGQSVFDALIARALWPSDWQLDHGDGSAPSAEAEIALRTMAGSDRLIAGRYAPLSGIGAGALLFGIDVSERQKAEEEREAVEMVARRSERLASLGTLAAGLAHELNNPIGIISSRIELMLLEDAEARRLSPDIREVLEVLRRHAMRVGRLAQGLLSFARHRIAEQSLVNLADVVRDVLLLTEPQIVKSGSTVRATLGADPAIVAGDGASLQQVVLNLVTNAWQALNGPGEIRVETRGGNDDRVELVVEDTGRGMSTEELARIFDPFFTTRPDGTGLGLSITHGIVRDHGGTIHVESTPGQGTRFVVSFPSA
jgi:two-component system NtrC family sensor kinase